MALHAPSSCLHPRERVRPLSSAELDALCKAVCNTAGGLTGSELSQCLAAARVVDTDPSLTKWRRLFNALATAQNANGTATPILNFLHHALAPARFAGDRTRGDAIRMAANVALAFVGLQMQDNGKFTKVAAAATLKDAERRANDLHATLAARGIHPDVLRFCRAELLEDNYFHAVREAAKSVAQKVRDRTGHPGDGAAIFSYAFSGDQPRLRINGLTSESEWSEQKGFQNLLVGMSGVFRNPTSHAPRAAWIMAEEDALDFFSLASYAHRRIDRATVHA